MTIELAPSNVSTAKANMISSRVISIGLALLVFGLQNPAYAEGNVEAGAKIFKKCSACHKIGEGAKNAIGPVLTGIIGRKAGTFEDYRYGKSTKAAGKKGLVWSEEEIFKYLVSPKKFLRAYLDTRKAKSKMKFELKSEKDRRNVIAYLASFSTEESKAMPPKSADQVGDTAPKMSAKTSETMVTDTAGKICVTNESSTTLLFVAEAGNGQRKLETLPPSKTLCIASQNPKGTIGVFENEDALEGCSRLAKTGTPERLISYTPFDNCAWAG